MKELTITIDCWSHKELKEYLNSLKGISEVDINGEDKLEIYIKYNSDLITLKIIELEILSFLKLLNVPSIMGFDKHSDKNLKEYLIIRKDICCEYCVKGVVEDLFFLDGIEKVEATLEKDTIIKIKYDSKVLSLNDVKNIDLNLDL